MNGKAGKKFSVINAIERILNGEMAQFLDPLFLAIFHFTMAAF